MALCYRQYTRRKGIHKLTIGTLLMGLQRFGFLMRLPILILPIKDIYPRHHHLRVSPLHCLPSTHRHHHHHHLLVRRRHPHHIRHRLSLLHSPQPRTMVRVTWNCQIPIELFGFLDDSHTWNYFFTGINGRVEQTNTRYLS